MSGETVSTISLATVRDVAFARQAASRAMKSIGASTIKQTRFVTAVSEIARNAVIYGHGGFIAIEILGASPRQSVLARCTDRGPGIPDIETAMADGYSTGDSLGKGLGGARRLVDRFEIASSFDTGTIVTLESRAR